MPYSGTDPESYITEYTFVYENKRRGKGCAALLTAIGAFGALMNRVQQPRTLLVLGLNAGMSTAAGADELVEIPAQKLPTRAPHSGGRAPLGRSRHTHRHCKVTPVILRGVVSPDPRTAQKRTLHACKE